MPKMPYLNFVLAWSCSLSLYFLVNLNVCLYLRMLSVFDGYTRYAGSKIDHNRRQFASSTTFTDLYLGHCLYSLVRVKHSSESCRNTASIITKPKAPAYLVIIAIFGSSASDTLYCIGGTFLCPTPLVCIRIPGWQAVLGGPQIYEREPNFQGYPRLSSATVLTRRHATLSLCDFACRALELQAIQ